jgi:outer membrane receptor protein involved in Fe transport
MSHKKAVLFGAAATAALFMAQSGVAAAAEAAAAPAGSTSVTEVIVTAQKRQENIQNVGMSIQAASGDKLTKLGITDTSQLQKIVPGFLFTPTYYGTVVYTIRGVGFQDTSLAGSPTVSVYLDEAPLPFSTLALGATLDLQRVEVLKGPQGTLFGNNATGGAINYIANKPTDTYQAGFDFSYGRFSDVNAQGYVSGPVADGLDLRLAVQSHTSGAWQKGYGPSEGPSSAGQSTGGQDFLNGRFSALWKPNDRFKAYFVMNGWQDKSYDQVGQFYGVTPLSPSVAISPGIANYPFAPHNNQAAAWLNCVNSDPFDPITGQEFGTTFNAPNANLPGVPESQGTGSVVQAGGQPEHCVPMKRNNNYYSFALRMDYDLGHDLTVTSLTDYQRFTRDQPLDGSGIPYQDYQNIQYGKITSVFQELRLSGKFWGGKGNWIIGGNYEYDSTWDRLLQTYNASTASPTDIPFAFLCPVYDPASANNICTSPQSATILSGGKAVPNAAYDAVNFPQVFLDTLGPTQPANRQFTDTWAIYAHGEYPLTDTLNLIGGIRYTQEDKKGLVCGADGGDGSWAHVASQISNLLEVLNGTISFQQYLAPNTGLPAENSADGAIGKSGGFGISYGPYSCGTTGPGPLYQSFGPVYASGTLNQSNIAWEAGLDWKFQPQTLLYAHVSQGWKGGSFPTVAMSAYTQSFPVVQEGLLSYEVGFKTTQFDNQLTVNGAAFYYAYDNKQILGALADPIFGALPSLVNVPASHVVGFELSGTYTPEWLKGLTITPAVSYQNSNIDASSRNTCDQATLDAHGNGSLCVPGHFYNFDAYSHYADFTNQPFPSAPEWQASVDAEYDWKVPNDITAFVGLNYNYTSQTHTFFQNHQILPGMVYDPNTVPAYSLLDLRAGVSKDAWRFQLWGRNVTNQWYWTSSSHVNDVVLRFTGMPTTYGFTLSYRFH